MIPREEILQFERHACWVKSIFGGGTWLATFSFSTLSTIEAWLRITSLCVGIGVGIATVISLLRKK